MQLTANFVRSTLNPKITYVLSAFKKQISLKLSKTHYKHVAQAIQA